jgi:hypothetical protein
METDIRKILQRGIITLISIILMIILNLYLDHRQESNSPWPGKAVISNGLATTKNIHQPGPAEEKSTPNLPREESGRGLINVYDR